MCPNTDQDNNAAQSTWSEGLPSSGPGAVARIAVPSRQWQIGSLGKIDIAFGCKTPESRKHQLDREYYQQVRTAAAELLLIGDSGTSSQYKKRPKTLETGENNKTFFAVLTIVALTFVDWTPLQDPQVVLKNFNRAPESGETIAELGIPRVAVVPFKPLQQSTVFQYPLNRRDHRLPTVFHRNCRPLSSSR